jgi:hypothetical protein
MAELFDEENEKNAIYLMSETKNGDWDSGVVYRGIVSDDKKFIHFNKFAPMPYTEELKMGVKGAFILSGKQWNQNKLRKLYQQQKKQEGEEAELIRTLFMDDTNPLGPERVLRPEGGKRTRSKRKKRSRRYRK